MNFDYLNQIVGEKLSAVVFVMDYHQLQFDGPSFTISESHNRDFR